VPCFIILTMRATTTLPTKLDRLIEFLDSLPDDEVLTTQEVMSILKVNRKDTIYTWARQNVRLSFYCYLVPLGSGSHYYVFGNPSAIIATRKQMENNEDQ
jgi:hypothetical protein